MLQAGGTGGERTLYGLPSAESLRQAIRSDGRLSMRLERKHSLRLLQAAISVAIVYYLLQLVDWQAVEQLLVSGILPALWPGPLILLLGLLLAAER